MTPSLILLLLVPAVFLQEEQQKLEEDLVITVGELVQMYNEEEGETLAPVIKHPKLISNQEVVDINSVAGNQVIMRQ